MPYIPMVNPIINDVLGGWYPSTRTFQSAFGPTPYLTIGANQTLYVNEESILRYTDDLGGYYPPEDGFRKIIGTWLSVKGTINFPPFLEDKKYFFFNNSHKFGDLYPYSGLEADGYKFEVRRPGDWIKAASGAANKLGIPKDFQMSQGPHDPQFTGKFQYGKLQDCQIAARFWAWTSWSRLPSDEEKFQFFSFGFNLFDSTPFPHRHKTYLSDKVGGTGATISTHIHPSWAESFKKKSNILRDSGFDHHTHEIIDGYMMPAGNPPHVHNYFVNEFFADAPGPASSVSLPTSNWRNPANDWNDISTPVYVSFMYLFASDFVLQENFGLGTLGTIISAPPGPQAEQIKQEFLDNKTKLFKNAIQIFRETELKQGSFYAKGGGIISTGASVMISTAKPVARNTPEYADTSFQLTKPFPTSTTKMSFNWYEKCYADALAKSPNHGILPSLHLNILKLEDPDRFIMLVGPWGQEESTGFFNDGPYGNIFSMGNSPYFSPDGMDYGLEPYFNAWIHSMNNGHVPSTKNIKKTNNILFPSSKYLDKYTSQEHVFPWASELGLYTIPIKEESLAYFITQNEKQVADTEQTNPVSEYLQQWFMKWAVDYMHHDGKTVGPDFSPVTSDFDVALKESFMVKQNIRVFHGEPTTTSTLKDLEVWDLTYMLAGNFSTTYDLIEQMETPEIEQLVYSLSVENGLVIDPPPSNTDNNMSQSGIDLVNTNEYMLALFLVILKAKLRENNPELGYGPQCIADLFNGKLAYAEPIFYEIRKFEFTAAGTWKKEHVQSFYIAAPFEKNFVNFIDTQLKYNKSYFYDVFAYTLVVGNTYRHNGINEFPLLYTDEKVQGALVGTKQWGRRISGGEGTYPTAIMTAVNRPSIQLIKVPYTSFSTIHVADAPPTPPFVEISAYKNVNNKLLFWLSETIGKFVDAKPIVVRPGDKELFINAYHSSQGIYGDPDNLPDTIRFSADSKIKRYERFRIDKHPSKYTDFASGYKALPPGHDDLVDILVPNKKYYYIFRSVDQHDYISNPTPIYQVELVHNSGATYPIIKVVDLKPVITKVKQKAGRKYVYIAPTFEQSIMKIDKTKTNAANDTPHFAGSTLGGSILPHKFKLRFTSKTSCKKFDLNVNFSHKHDDNPGENYKWNNENLCYEYVNKPGENDEGKSNPGFPRIPPFMITPELFLEKCDVAENIGATGTQTDATVPPTDTALNQKQIITLKKDLYEI